MSGTWSYVWVLFKNTIRLLDEAEALDQLSRELHIRVSEIVASLDSKFWLPCLCYIVCPSLSRSRSARRYTSNGYDHLHGSSNRHS